MGVNRRKLNMLLMEKVAKLVGQNETFALAMIIESKGSTPRHVGKMIVYPDGTIEGTVGGGYAELVVIEESVKAIEKRRSTIVECKLNMDAKGGLPMLCGGVIRVFIEVYAKKPELIFVGAGHVGYALSKLADYLEYPYSIVDDRIDYCTKVRFPNAKQLHVDEEIEKAIIKANLNENSHVSIFTKDCDFVALRTVLKYPCAYVGMIGSKRKTILIFEKLKERGVSQDLLDLVHSPIGIDIGAETSEEIAISIMAEIIKESRERSISKVNDKENAVR
jgi:xanthine dehydrogenase accessory factor